MLHDPDPLACHDGRYYGLPFVVLCEKSREVLCGYFQANDKSDKCQVMKYSKYQSYPPNAALEILGGTSQQRRYSAVYAKLFQKFSEMAIAKGLVDDSSVDKLFTRVTSEISNLACQLDSIRELIRDAAKQKQDREELATSQAYKSFLTQSMVSAEELQHASSVAPMQIREVTRISEDAKPSQYVGSTIAEAVRKIPFSDRVVCGKRPRTVENDSEYDMLQHYQNTYTLINGKVQRAQAQASNSSTPALDAEMIGRSVESLQALQPKRQTKKAQQAPVPRLEPVPKTPPVPEPVPEPAPPLSPPPQEELDFGMNFMNDVPGFCVDFSEDASTSWALDIPL